VPDPQPCVLVVDDDAPTVELLAELFADEGYAVRTAKDVGSALASEARERADVIVLDLLLPDQDGTVFVERYRAGGGGAPIVVLSAARDAARRAAAIGSPLISKPFEVRDLLETVRQAVERSR
jgi:DNA-binding response OmpR family regulator